MPRAKMRMWVALGATVVAFAGCAGNDGVDAVTEKVPLPKGISQCEDIYKANAVVNPKTFGDACAEGQEMVVPRPVVLRCANSKVLYWNDFAWGYENERMTLIDQKAAAHDRVPYDPAMKCLVKKTPTDTDTATDS